MARSANGAPDWDAIERVYRTGIMSNRQIGEKYGCHESSIRERARKQGWTRDLKADVKAATERKLLKATRDETKKTSPADPAELPRTAGLPAPITRNNLNAEEKQLVETASDMQAHVVLEHRRLALKGRDIVDTLFQELSSTIRNREDIEDDIYEETKGDKTGERRSRMMAAVSLSNNAGVVKDLAGALKLLIGNERQAYGLSEKVPEKPPETENEGKIDEMRRYMHEQLTRGPMARPGGPLPVIDQRPSPPGALTGKGQK